MIKTKKLKYERVIAERGKALAAEESYLACLSGKKKNRGKRKEKKGEM